MAKIQKKFIQDNAVDESKIELSNDGFLVGLKNAGGDQSIIKVRTDDALELGAKVYDVSAAAPSADAMLANKKYVDDQVSGAITGLGNAMEFKGGIDASGALTQLDNASVGWYFRVTTAGTLGGVELAVGDAIVCHTVVTGTPTDLDDFLKIDNTDIDNQNASEVPFTPAGTLAASDVQAAIAELDSEMDARVNSLADARIAAASVTDLSDVTSAGSGAIITSGERAKIGHLSVTQAVDLDTLETDVGLNNTHRSSDGSDHSKVTANETAIGVNATNLSNHLVDAVDAHDASAISYDDTTSGSGDADVQSFLDNFLDQDVSSGAAPTLDGSNISGIISGDVDTTHVLVKKSTAGTIPAGKAVYAVGIDSGIITVELADASDANKMPAIGITETAVTDTSTDKFATVVGKLTAVDMSSFSVGDKLYVSASVAGDLISTKPTGAANLIQKVGQVTEAAVSGSLLVTGAGRSNDIPNLSSNNVWLGDGSGIAQEANLDTEISANADVVANTAHISSDGSDHSKVTANESAISTNASNISSNDTDISNLQGALGASIESSINYANNNYITDGEDLVVSAGKLDAQVKLNADAASDAQNEIDAVEGALGAAVSSAGAYVAHSGSNYIDGNSDLTEDLLDLDTQVKANADAVAGVAVPQYESVEILASHVTNGYLDLAAAASSVASVMVTPVGGPQQEFGEDYTISLTGGAGGFTRVTFAGDLLDLAAGDFVIVRYLA